MKQICIIGTGYVGLVTGACFADLGNTVVVVEHDEDTMRAADHLIDFGPGAGSRGGQIMAAGTPDEVAHTPESITARARFATCS